LNECLWNKAHKYDTFSKGIIICSHLDFMFEKTFDAILVVPPWTLINTPHLGLHIIQASLKEKGFNAYVLYSDQLLAKQLGIDKYRKISEEYISQYELIQDRLFAKSAYPSEFPFLGGRICENGTIYATPRDRFDTFVDWEYLFSIENIIDLWVNETAYQLAHSNVKVIGFSISHQQTNATIALINKIKSFDPNKVIVVGGSNCDGEMSEGILSLSQNIDYVFSGKCDVLLADIFLDVLYKRIPRRQVIYSHHNIPSDEIPVPDYDDYFIQCEINGFQSLTHWVNIESSRGCWWSVKNQCNFCGVNGSYSGKYKIKSPEKIYAEIMTLKNRHKVVNFRMVDTLMPSIFFKQLLPKLFDKNLNIFYELRADLSFNEFEILKLAGIKNIQIGIESLCTEHLKLINKGSTVSENINSLRYCSILGISLGWNLLYAVPNDKKEELIETLELLPFIEHLIPPLYFRPIELARFSPYFNQPARFGISNIKHFDVYDDIYPKSAKINSLSWLFTGNYNTASNTNSTIVSKIEKLVQLWIDSWSDRKQRAYLTIISVRKQLALVDSRGLNGCRRIQMINQEQASVALLGDKSICFEQYKSWGIENKVLVRIDSEYIPLATCPPDYYKYILMNYEQ
jgi:ribosomal peptide maturation radical SAM protein 1